MEALKKWQPDREQMGIERTGNKKPAKELKEDVFKKLEEFRYWMRGKRYSDNSIKTYLTG